MGKYFGTDGVRGVANSELTPELAFKVGRFGGYVLTKDKQRPKVLIGRDTRISGHMLEEPLSPDFYPLAQKSCAWVSFLHQVYLI